MKISGHPYYQNFDAINTYENRCKEVDETGNAMLFGNCGEEQLEVVESTDDESENEKDEDESSDRKKDTKEASI